MKKTILSALIAATALVPVMASAQDQGRRGNRGDGGPFREQRQAARAERQAERAAQPQQQANPNREAFRAQRQAERAARPAAPVVQQQQQVIRPPQDLRNRQQFRTERRDDRQDFRQERREDRRNLNNGVVTQQQFRNDRRDDRQDYRADRRDDRQDFRRDQNRGGSWNNNGNWNRGNGSWNRGNDNRWNRQWRNDNRYNWQSWRGQNRNVYRLPRYYAPRGYNYGYQRFGIGVTLGSILFSQNYWINDPWAYRLPPAYGPYRWVRYYNDALLVDIETGEVVDVINDIFW